MLCAAAVALRAVKKGHRGGSKIGAIVVGSVGGCAGRCLHVDAMRMINEFSVGNRTGLELRKKIST